MVINIITTDQDKEIENIFLSYAKKILNKRGVNTSSSNVLTALFSLTQIYYNFIDVYEDGCLSDYECGIVGNYCYFKYIESIEDSDYDNENIVFMDKELLPLLKLSVNLTLNHNTEVIKNIFRKSICFGNCHGKGSYLSTFIYREVCSSCCSPYYIYHRS